MRALISFAAWACDWQDYALHPPPRQNHGPVHRTRGFNRGIQREDISLEGNTSITLIMSAIFFELSAISCIFSLRHPPLCRRAGRCRRHFAQLRGLAGVIGVLLHCRGELPMLAAVSSSADACCSVREERRCCPPQFHGYRHRWHLNLRGMSDGVSQRALHM